MSEGAAARPVTGRWFEELTPGLVIDHADPPHGHRGRQHVLLGMTMNPQPLHLDETFAAESRVRRPPRQQPLHAVAAGRHQRARDDAGHDRGQPRLPGRRVPRPGLPRRHDPGADRGGRRPGVVVAARPGHRHVRAPGVQPARRAGGPLPAGGAHAPAARDALAQHAVRARAPARPGRQGPALRRPTWSCSTWRTPCRRRPRPRPGRRWPRRPPPCAGRVPVCVRVNPPATPWFAGRRGGPARRARGRRRAQVGGAERSTVAAPRSWPGSRPCAGVADVRDAARPARRRLLLRRRGLRGRPGRRAHAAATPRCSTPARRWRIAARLAGVPALDHGHARLPRRRPLRREAAGARALGYAGQAVHPPGPGDAGQRGLHAVGRRRSTGPRRLLAAFDAAGGRGHVASRARWSTRSWPSTPAPSWPAPARPDPLGPDSARLGPARRPSRGNDCRSGTPEAMTCGPRTSLPRDRPGASHCLAGARGGGRG